MPTTDSSKDHLKDSRMFSLQKIVMCSMTKQWYRVLAKYLLIPCQHSQERQDRLPHINPLKHGIEKSHNFVI